MRDCIFCKIIGGEVPATKIMENDKFIAILDITPVTPGHTLVIPKKHRTSFFDMPIKELKEMIEFTRKVANIVMKGMDADGANIMLFEGEASNKTVSHDPHFHIIPRKLNDGLNLNPPRRKYKQDEMEEIARRISEKV